MWLPAKIISDREHARSTILVVERHACLRDVARVILERCGYRVLTAPSGRIAENILSNCTEIQLVLTDLEMPDGSGEKLAAWCQAHRPGVQVVFMREPSQAKPASGTWSVEMPFIHIDVLIETVREAMSSTRSSAMLECVA